MKNILKISLAALLATLAARSEAGDVSLLNGCDKAGSIAKLQQYNVQLKKLKTFGETKANSINYVKGTSCNHDILNSNARTCTGDITSYSNLLARYQQELTAAKTAGEAMALPMEKLKYPACAQALRTATVNYDMAFQQNLESFKQKCGCGNATP